MSDHDKLPIKRRDLLRTIGTGTAVGVVGAGTAGAKPTGRFIVGTKNGIGIQKARQAATSVHRELDFGSIGRAVAGQFPEQARKALEKNPNVRYVEEDGRMEAIGEALPWGVDRTDSDLAQDAGYTGDGAHIAVIDTGIDSDHPDLQANLGAGKAFTSCSSCTESWDDDNNHGTHCAGIAAAVDNSTDVVGVAPGATLHAVKVLASDGWGTYSDIAAGIQYTADQGWDVASLSIGGSTSSYTMDDAIQYATDNGVLCVAAAGNNGPCTDCVMYPARHPEVLAVSATGSGDDLAYFSCTGPEIDIAAPGASILSTVRSGTAYYSGTSMACPHVSGAAGLLMANGYSNTEARARLEETAEDIGLAANEQGNGLLDVEAALGNKQNTNMIGEAGTVSVDENWTTVSLSGSYTDPVVVTSVGTYNDPDPVHARVRNAQSGSFEVRLEEWEYQDGVHSSETIHYVVMESGTHETSAGIQILAGTVQADGSSFTTANYGQTFNSQRYVFTQVMTVNDPTPVSTRVTDVGLDSFDVVCQEEEINRPDGFSDHAQETVGYVVTQPRPGSTGGTGESLASVFATNQWASANLKDSYSSTPVILNGLQSYFGRDTTNLRGRNYTSSSFEVLAEEEQSKNTEVAHVREYVATLALPSGGITEL